MEGFEPKKLALLRVLEILQNYSDCDHPLKQEDIIEYLINDYGIEVERKTIGRNLALLKEAGYEIESTKQGSYLAERPFEDSELRLLIDGVLASKHITAKHSKELINKLCGLSNKYFRRHVKNIYSVNDWGKTDNQALFYNIEIIDEAIENGKMVQYDYNKFGADKNLHKSSFQRVSPYQLILHNQRYYLMGYSKYWEHMVYHRLDHITNIQISERDAIPIRDIDGYKNGINYQELTTAMPYMYNDKPEKIVFTASEKTIDHVIDWFGKDIEINKKEDEVTFTLTASPKAMLYWAVQYADEVEILKPAALREEIKIFLNKAVDKYK
ncbi:MAG: WYL domain-containing protein [Clostridia bacterium]|nr:WYL domain-containing protein [Clostridia bacterium]